MKTPPSTTTIRVKSTSTNAVEMVGDNIMKLLHDQLENGTVWNVEVASGMQDLVICTPNPSRNEDCKQLYPRIAVDQYAAAAIMRGADLMAVGVIGLDFGEKLG